VNLNTHRANTQYCERFRGKKLSINIEEISINYKKGPGIFLHFFLSK